MQSTFLCALDFGSGNFTRIFLSKREPCASPSLLVGIGLRTTHIWGKHKAKGWVYSLRAFHLFIPFTSLSLSPLYPFHLSLPPSLSLLFLPPSLYLSFYLSFSLSFSLSSLYYSLWRI